MRRRQFMTLLGAAAAWPLAARAQQGVRRVAVLSSIGESDQEAQLMVAGLHDGLQALGWVNGRNLRIDHRWAAGSSDRVAALAKELVALSPDVIVAHTTPSGLALQRATDTIPIVFVQVSDPEGSGLVANIAHPGANTTGFPSLQASMAGKWLEMLREMAPGIARAAILFNPDTASYVGRYYQAPFEAAASALGVTALTFPVRNVRELEGMIGELAGAAGGALLRRPGAFNIVHRDRIIELTARHRIPSISPYRFAVKKGSLMSYGIDFVDEEVAGVMKLEVSIVEVRALAELDAAMAAASRNGPDALVMLSSPIIGGSYQALANFTLQRRLAAVTLFPVSPAAAA